MGVGIFNFRKKPKTASVSDAANNEAELSKLVLNNIAEGVIIIDGHGLVKLLNPAAASLIGYERPDLVIGLDYSSVIRLQNQQGKMLADSENPLVMAVKRNEPLSTRKLLIIANDNQRQTAVHLTMVPTGDPNADKIITFRDITKELAEENEQAEFISTASHEMRTPVAAIEGYLGLALSPQTATIDERARQYLTEAHNASRHLGELFKDLLDVTKLDDGRLQPHPAPLEVVSTVKSLADEYSENITAKHLTYTFGTDSDDSHKIDQIVYASLDLSFLREIMDNLIGNAVKYTPEGGHIWVNVRGDGDKVLINVTDSGIGISADDLNHIFQKFYRVDNSATRSIGGTGLGLYLVKQRVEAMGGRVWAESVFGEGSTFYVSFPRLTEAEYQRLKLASENSRIMQGFVEGAPVTAPAASDNSGAAFNTGAVPVSQRTVISSGNLPPSNPAAQPTTAQPVMPQPVVAQPVMPQPVVAQPVMSPAPAPQPVTPPVTPQIAPLPAAPVVTPTAQPVTTPAAQPVTTPAAQPVTPSANPPTAPVAMPATSPTIPPPATNQNHV